MNVSTVEYKYNKQNTLGNSVSYRMGPESPRGGYGSYGVTSVPNMSSNILGIENSTDRGDEINLDELQKYIGRGEAGGKRY